MASEQIGGQPRQSAFMLGALGVVFGDIGTSPIYAFRKSIKASHDPAKRENFVIFREIYGWRLLQLKAEHPDKGTRLWP